MDAGVSFGGGGGYRMNNGSPAPSTPATRCRLCLLVLPLALPDLLCSYILGQNHENAQAPPEAAAALLGALLLALSSLMSAQLSKREEQERRTKSRLGKLRMVSPARLKNSTFFEAVGVYRRG